MRLRDDFVAVKVPATSANLGPGFDSLGLALSLYDDIAVHAVTGATSVVIEGEGAGSVDTGENNLVVRALRIGLDHVGAPQVGIRMHCTNRIPHGRGLGSSAAAIVAGLTLARALVGDPEVLTAGDLLQLSTDMEGHPDNVAPAILGGATVAWMDDGVAGALSLTPPTNIAPVAFIPAFELSTSKARAALPSQVPHGDASTNAGRAAILAAVLADGQSRYVRGEAVMGGGAHELLMAGTEDRLHQEYRRGVMEPSLALVDWLREAGFAAVISGAGPTVLSLETVPADVREQARAAGWTVMPLPVAPSGVAITRGRLSKEAI